MWKSVSDEGKDLIRRMLDPNYETRISTFDALNHPWFTSSKDTNTECNPEVIESLKRYGEFSDIKKKILNLLVKSIDSADLREIQKVFSDLDKERTGLITCENLKEYLEASGHQPTAEELARILKKANRHGEALINYSEFIAAVISTQKFLTEERLWYSFKTMDPKREGTINHNILEDAFNDREELPKPIAIDTLKRKTHHDEKITFEQFKIILLN